MGNKLMILPLVFFMALGGPLGLAAQDVPKMAEAAQPSQQAGELAGDTSAIAVIPPEEEPAEEEMVQVKPGHVTVNFKEADIRTVLNYFSEVSGIDIVPAPNVEGTVTLKLTDKPWEIALDVIVRNYGYAIEREQDIIRIVRVEDLRKQELATEVIELNYATAQEIEPSVEDMLSDRGKITYDTRTNILLVTDVPASIYKIKQIVSKLDKRTPQIMIEARIIETTLEKDEKLGIDWNIKIAAVGAKRPTTVPFNSFLSDWGFDSAAIRGYVPVGQTGTDTITIGAGGATQTTEPGAFPGTAAQGSRSFPFIDQSIMYDVFTYGTLDFSQFSAVLEMIKSRRDSEIISNPKITTLDNQEAKIVVGQVYNFPTFSQVEETGRWVISGYDPKELGIKLYVTPHVNERGEIAVDLKPEISNYLGLEQISPELSAPLWSTREAETQVIVKDNDTIFIGGLITENIIEVDKRVPFFGDLFGGVPFFGNLLKHKSEEKQKTELIFFITVHIVQDLAALKAEGVTLDKNEVFVPMDAPGAVMPQEKKEGKPWLDFRKTKKNEGSNKQ